MNSSENKTGARRPLASRETGPAKRISTLLVKFGFSPNGISVAGMFAGIAAGIVLAMTAQYATQEWWLWILGAVLVQCRLLANMFDGMVAIESGKASAVGELYNEIPDRVSDLAIIIGFGYAAGSCPALGYFAAALAVFVAYVRAEGAIAGGDQEFCGPMAKPQRMFIITIAALLSAFLPSKWSSFTCNCSGQEVTLNQSVLVLIVLGCVVTIVRRLGKVSRKLKNG